MRRPKLTVRNKKWMRFFRLFTFSLLLCLPCGKAYAFKIVEPVDSSTLASGQTIPAKVELGSDQVSSKFVTFGIRSRRTPWWSRMRKESESRQRIRGPTINLGSETA